MLIPSLHDPSQGTPVSRADRAPARRPGFQAPCAEGTIDWDALLPRTLYARRIRGVVNAALGIGLLPFALLLGLPIALANLCLFQDPRLILFVQPRVGRRGRVFRIYKFRTMCVQRGAPADQAFDAKAPHVTRFGRLLRNSHLDELPQVLNILKRDMDVIGPRPEMVEIERWAAAVVPGFSTRLAIRPGITGRAQITQGYTGRDVDAYARKLSINLDYMRAMSLRHDVEIVARTAAWMLRGRGARASTPPALACEPGSASRI